MPYDKISDLPDSVKNNLPKHAQEIYFEAYNNAFEQYAKAEKRRDDSTREETAHKVAWAAVKKKYKKEGNKWVRRKGRS
jgi:cation transport regulator